MKSDIVYPHIRAYCINFSNISNKKILVLSKLFVVIVYFVVFNVVWLFYPMMFVFISWLVSNYTLFYVFFISFVNW